MNKEIVACKMLRLHFIAEFYFGNGSKGIEMVKIIFIVIYIGYYLG